MVYRSLSSLLGQLKASVYSAVYQTAGLKFSRRLSSASYRAYRKMSLSTFRKALSLLTSSILQNSGRCASGVSMSLIYKVTPRSFGVIKSLWTPKVRLKFPSSLPYYRTLT